MAGDPITAKAGQEVLLAGGNAYDAITAASFTSFASESTLTSLGGGGFCLAAPSNCDPVLYDFFCQTPHKRKKASDLEFYDVDVNFTDSKQKFHIGLGTAAVPGCLAGLAQVHKELGKMPLVEVLRPAIEAAKKGIEVTPYIYMNFHIVSDILLAETPSSEIYKPGGKLLKVGERYYLPEYADLLEILPREGVDIFYRGDLAQRIVSDMKERGGHLSLKDFDSYRVIKREPFKFHYRDYEILTNPPPSSGGILIAFMLKLLERVSLNGTKFGTGKHLNFLVNCLRMTAESRKIYLDSKHHDENLVEEFLHDGRMDALGQELSKASAKFPNTTHISVKDSVGNLAALTTSFGTGSGYNIPGSNSMLNNMLGEDDLNPEGFHMWPFNQRVTSMMSPTIVSNSAGPLMVMGSGGANRIRTAIMQSIVNYLDLGLDPDNSINAPRIHWEDNTFSYEPGYQQDEINQVDDIENFKIDQYSEPNMFFGGVHAILYDENQEPVGAGDRRREGIVLYA